MPRHRLLARAVERRPVGRDENLQPAVEVWRLVVIVILEQAFDDAPEVRPFTGCRHDRPGFVWDEDAETTRLNVQSGRITGKRSCIVHRMAILEEGRCRFDFTGAPI